MVDLKKYRRICVLKLSALETSIKGGVCLRVKTGHKVPSENYPEGVLPVGEVWYVEFYYTYFLVMNEADFGQIEDCCQRCFGEVVRVPHDEFANLYLKK